ncbi:MAG: hypothetical protein M1829_001522 [Trizodia sp. TS-e1964]|nr:MAG: hypothetical protein M1829_001522 [Trizodia sp. TS-e1964]
MSPTSHPHHRTERNIHDVNKQKAARRAEIERRSLALNPPLDPQLLNHMDSFQAAIQIPIPLTDGDWELLLPRLQAQRCIAEEREKEIVAQSIASQAKLEGRRLHDVKLKERKDLLDKEWEEAQQPIRARVGQYADEIIDFHWQGGKGINSENCPRFAVDVLNFVRKRFYADVSKEDADLQAKGEELKQDPPERAKKRMLILENMKWTFDTKIKPLTEQYRKELFLCHDCNPNSRFYGFEGVIQHFAAKHTHKLSLGSIVVYWRAEWPEYSPFHPNPYLARASFQSKSNQASISRSLQPYNTAITGYNGIPQHLNHPGIERPPYMGYSPFVAGNQHGPFTSSEPLHQSSGFPRTYRGFPNPIREHPLPSLDSGYQDIQGFNPPFQSGSPHPCGLPMRDIVPPLCHNHGDLAIRGHSDCHESAGRLNYIDQVTPSQTLTSREWFKHHNHPSLLGSDPSQEIALIARDLWSRTSGIKDMPSSVRIYVVIFHLVSLFKARFGQEPNFDMFISVVATQQLMKPLRGVVGLVCKTCSKNWEVGSRLSPETPQVSFEREKFSFGKLIDHFQLHIGHRQRPSNSLNGVSGPGLDWREDMIELPRGSEIARLLHAHGMDADKLHLISAALPRFFPSQLPNIVYANNYNALPISEIHRRAEMISPTIPKGIYTSQVIPYVPNDRKRKFSEDINLEEENQLSLLDSGNFQQYNHSSTRYHNQRDDLNAFRDFAYSDQHQAGDQDGNHQSPYRKQVRQLRGYPQPEQQNQKYSRNKHAKLLHNLDPNASSTNIIPQATGNSKQANSDEGLEDGEVCTAVQSKNFISKSTTPFEDLNAAESFLNEFIPFEDYHHHLDECSEPSRDLASIQKRSVKEEFAEPGYIGSGVESNHMRNSNNHDTSLRSCTFVPQDRDMEISATRVSEPNLEYFEHHSRPSAIRRPRSRENEPSEIKKFSQTKRSGTYREGRFTSEYPSYGRGKYGRYEQSRQEAYRARSRSPRATAQEVYRQRSPSSALPQFQHSYHNHPASRNMRVAQPSVDDSTSNQRVPITNHYLSYAEEPPISTHYYMSHVERIPPHLPKFHESGYSLDRHMQRQETPSRYSPNNRTRYTSKFAFED